jgi:hypothetical protein
VYAWLLAASRWLRVSETRRSILTNNNAHLQLEMVEHGLGDNSPKVRKTANGSALSLAPFEDLYSSSRVASSRSDVY